MKADKIKFTVQTFDQRGLEQVSAMLAAVVMKDFQPNIVIGVRSGGFVVAELMMDVLPVEAVLLPMTCRRPSTASKKRFSAVKDVLSALPHGVTDRLRVLEHHLLTQWREPASPDNFVPDENELAVLARQFAHLGANARVLVVDDSVDSGTTLQAVLNAVRAEMHDDAVLKSAAVTVTTEKPLAEPDYMLYRYVLCRFPWALDAKPDAVGNLRS